MKLHQMISTCCDAWIEHADTNGHGVCSECGENATPVTADMVLEDIFTVSPLPNELYMPRKRWREGKLQETAICSIIRKYSDYTPEITVYPPQRAEGTCSK